MKVLLVKMSSLGDVIHTLPALSDAAAAIPGIRFDWVVEEAFAEIPAWHRAVEQVVPIALRRWRKRPFRDFTGSEWRDFKRQLKRTRYDAVLDAQGLMKSAFVSRLVKAPRHGMDKASVRERLAALAYDHCVAVPRDRHAIDRLRLLFAKALAYPPPATPGDYGLATRTWAGCAQSAPGLVFLHGSARAEKLWPEQNWVELAKLAGQAGFSISLPWGNDQEHNRAARIARSAANAQVLPRQTLTQLATLLSQSRGVAAVDTGLGHLSAALNTPTVSLYGPTDIRLIGTYGNNQVQLESPPTAGGMRSMQAITPELAWQGLQSAMAGVGSA